MNLSFLYFLAESWFVIPWYVIGTLGAVYLIYDMRVHNTILKPAIQWAWPIIVFFFSVIGLALYFLTARAPGIGKKQSKEEKQKLHNQYETSMWRRVNGAVIHCVAGDGFGIMTAMVIARAGGFSFWQEFWFEYVVGFAIGWFLFQRKSMTMMTDSLPKQLAMAFRGEFFSMLTVMGGMGAVMTYVTPLVATSQPKPLTYAFWGFGMLGLLVGYAFTFPMNWMMVKVGWKHGMGDMEGSKQHQVKGLPKKAGLVGAMVALGCVALLMPAWLTYAREHTSIPGVSGSRTALLAASAATAPGQTLFEGLRTTIGDAMAGIQQGNYTQAALAMDAAHRAAEVGAHAAPGSFYHALEQIHTARLAYQQGNQNDALDHLDLAARMLQPATTLTPPATNLEAYEDATVLDARGTIIGTVSEITDGALELSLGGWHDAWGVIDFGAGRHVTVPANALAYGPPNTVGMTLVTLPNAPALGTL